MTELYGKGAKTKDIFDNGMNITKMVPKIFYQSEEHYVTLKVSIQKKNICNKNI